MPANSKTTQDFVPIQEIRDGVLILKDGSMRAVIMASSLNFALKSSDEQNSIIFQFQNLLNSLDFSLQFFIQSRELDIRPYIGLLEDRYKEQTTELMKIQTREYIEFIKTFVEASNIMTKGFFVVVPYSPPLIQAQNKGLKGIIAGPKKAKAMPQAEFEEHKSQLDQRVAVVEQGLIRCGIRVALLGTEEVVELFYRIFNPGDTEKPIKTS